MITSSGGISSGLTNGGSPTKWVQVNGKPGGDWVRRKDRGIGGKESQGKGSVMCRSGVVERAWLCILSLPYPGIV